MGTTKKQPASGKSGSPSRSPMQISIRVDKTVWKEIKLKAVKSGAQPGVYVEEIFKRHCQEGQVEQAESEVGESGEIAKASPQLPTFSSPISEELEEAIREVNDLKAQNERLQTEARKANKQIYQLDFDLNKSRREEDRLKDELSKVRQQVFEFTRDNAVSVAREHLFNAAESIAKASRVVKDGRDKAKVRKGIDKTVKDVKKILGKLERIDV